MVKSFCHPTIIGVPTCVCVECAQWTADCLCEAPSGQKYSLEASNVTAEYIAVLGPRRLRSCKNLRAERGQSGKVLGK